MTMFIGARTLALHIPALWALSCDGIQLRFLGGYLMSIIFVFLRDAIGAIVIDADQSAMKRWGHFVGNFIFLAVTVMALMKVHKLVENGPSKEPAEPQPQAVQAQ